MQEIASARTFAMTGVLIATNSARLLKKRQIQMMKPAAVFHKTSSLCHSLVRLFINWAFQTISVIKTGVVLLSTGILICLCGCNTKKKEINSSSNNSVNPIAQTLEQRLTDSLFRYIHLTEFIQRVDISSDTSYVLYGREVNKNKIGVIVIEPKKLLLFQNIKNKFILTDSFAFDNYADEFDIDDLNGDNKEDLILYGGWDVHGNKYPFVFLSDTNNVLHYRPELQLPNISYDWNKKLVKSFWVGGAYDLHSKHIYRWINDSLDMIARVELDLTNQKYTETRVYKIVNGKEIIDKKSRNDNDELYDTALFKINGF